MATTKQRLEAELADSFKKCKAREQLIANLEVSYLINILLEYLIRISYWNILLEYLIGISYWNILLEYLIRISY